MFTCFMMYTIKGQALKSCREHLGPLASALLNDSELLEYQHTDAVVSAFQRQTKHTCQAQLHAPSFHFSCMHPLSIVVVWLLLLISNRVVWAAHQADC